jgi:hypothetical protein
MGENPGGGTDQEDLAMGVLQRGRPTRQAPLQIYREYPAANPTDRSAAGLRTVDDIKARS